MPQYPTRIMYYKNPDYEKILKDHPMADFSFANLTFKENEY